MTFEFFASLYLNLSQKLEKKHYFQLCCVRLQLKIMVVSSFLYEKV